jgi:hypothetical protein
MARLSAFAEAGFVFFEAAVQQYPFHIQTPQTITAHAGGVCCSIERFEHASFRTRFKGK